jgi:5-formyltetrahydrofolate cyclo-ligase
VTSAKSGLRAAVRANRAEVDLSADDRTRLAHLLAWLPAAPGVLATYASVPGEPDTLQLIDALAHRGWEVRLPVIGREVDWAAFEGWDATRAAWQGIPSPTGRRLGAESLGEADIVIASCLQVDRDGYRLGVGGGWYDRALVHRDAAATVLAWGRDAELVDAVPREPHDVRVDAVVTESGFVWF